MFTIPNFLDRDNYLQNPIMRRFLKDRKIKFVESRADYINAITEYAQKSKNNEIETRDWLLKVVKEGSKEFCYRKIQKVEETYTNPDILINKLKEAFPDCPQTDILNYKNTYERVLIGYKIYENSCKKVDKVSFVFSNLVLYGERGKKGDDTILPVFVDVYFDTGFIVARIKAKATVYHYVESRLLSSDNSINTLDYAASATDVVIAALNFETERENRIVKNSNSEILYNIYNEYTFTPENIEDKIESVKDMSQRYADEIFSKLNLSILNKSKALSDLKIFVEKYISINGDYEEIFKEDRKAYLIKVSADDELDLTSIDTSSEKTVPLQCTDAFFDSKKSVIKGQKCKKLNLIFKRDNNLYLKNIPLVVQFKSNKNYGVFKTVQYAEEVDINNVLQTIFRNCK